MRGILKSSICVAASVLAFSFIDLHASAMEGSEAKGQSTDVEVMSYNIHHAVGTDGLLDVGRIAKIIEESGADVIGLQEVDKHWSSRSHFKDQARLLAMRLGMFYVYGSNLNLEPANPSDPRREYGTAILSEYPIIQSENYALPKVGNTEQRGLLEATINIKGNQLHYYNTHLALTVTERMLQMERTLDIVDNKKGPKVIMGDFNALPESLEMAPIINHYQDVFADSKGAYTYPAKKPSKRIDYIFTSDDIEIKESEVIVTNASDHLPLTAELELERLEPSSNGNK
ncbi:endonuclease/exonuclease/phosphatase family protein [Bacillus massilinigeriensis]|uniref:endonuclease/exonuclease/phosphatase family protein n=1 Tax=Bacillus mediterraneensis TaxID=1805474 RepID=UPI001F18AE9C|nr:endonuclease/exonuclease/phosphatase family protein [Bacillus mediterraneensis]